MLRSATTYSRSKRIHYFAGGVNEAPPSNMTVSEPSHHPLRHRWLCKEPRTAGGTDGAGVTRVTALGGSRKRVTTLDRRGLVTERYDVRWRALLRSGESRMFRQRFDRAADADQFVSQL